MNEPMFRLDRERGEPRRRFANPDPTTADASENGAAKAPEPRPYPAALASAASTN